MRVASAAVALLAGGMLVGGCTSGNTPRTAPEPHVAASGAEGPAKTRVQLRDIYSTVRLEGTVEAYDVVPVTATKAGNFVPASGIANGRTVKSGATIGRIETCPQPASADAPQPEKPAPQCSVVRTAVTAPVAGVLSGVYPQTVAAGAPVARIQPPGLHLKLPVADPALLYSFTTPPKSGKAELVGGPAGFVVTFENVVYAKESGVVSVFAAIPADVPAFAGLHAVVVFVTSVKDQVPTLPLSAVRGRAGTGQVLTVDASGKKKTVNVTIGASDDAYVEVTGIDTTLDVLLYPLESDFGG